MVDNRPETENSLTDEFCITNSNLLQLRGTMSSLVAECTTNIKTEKEGDLLD
ncbi:hypothetical protein [Listeria booriae]|uniref:hypothetical protein n=1 Tax=Listeria booriae TaxID=1552123 RepID=UPI001E4A8F93|nr:hypothetical protein [Listeria booriae]MCD2208571.1 hypothetical protein [Listeria booriae]